MLSIESSILPNLLFDSRAYIIRLEKELTNEKPFKGFKEKIVSGPQALSLDFSVDNFTEEGQKTYMYGLPERCTGKISLENTIDWEPYRLWTADHYSGDYDRSSMYGVVPMI